MRINSSTQELNWPENVNQKCLCPFVELKRKVGATDSLGAVDINSLKAWLLLGLVPALLQSEKN